MPKLVSPGKDCRDGAPNDETPDERMPKLVSPGNRRKHELMAAEEHAWRAPPTVEKGRERCTNWALWSRLDSADLGYPGRCSYWTPPRRGEIDEETTDEPLPDIDWLDAEKTEAIIVQMDERSRTAIRARYIERRRIGDIAKLLHMNRDNAEKLLFEAEARVGRG